MNPAPYQDSEQTIEQLINSLESLVDGNRAEAVLLTRGSAVIEPLARYLLSGPPRTISLPRCRVVRILGELGAYSTLIAYFRDQPLPEDPAVLFAEDAVRSEAAKELAQWKTEDSFQVLLHAVGIRATSGLVSALGEFRCSESIPSLFTLLEDDLCRDAAMESLRQMSNAAHQYGILLLRGRTDCPIHGPASVRRLRAVLHLFTEFELSPSEWSDLSPSLTATDPEVVITTAGIGLRIGSVGDRKEIFEALLRVSRFVNWSQENTIEALLDTDRDLASQVASKFVHQQFASRENVKWLDPSWRILKHALRDSRAET